MTRLTPNEFKNYDPDKLFENYVEELTESCTEFNINQRRAA
jgi:hypothetical protein